MRFFIDENARIELATYLSHLYPDHTYLTFQDEKLSGVDDIPLFQVLADRRFDVIISGDKQQLNKSKDEWPALQRSGLHWVGMPAGKLPGVEGIALAIAAAVAAFPLVLKEFKGAGNSRLAIKLKAWRDNPDRCSPTSVT